MDFIFSVIPLSDYGFLFFSCLADDCVVNCFHFQGRNEQEGLKGVMWLMPACERAIIGFKGGQVGIYHYNPFYDSPSMLLERVLNENHSENSQDLELAEKLKTFRKECDKAAKFPSN